MRHILSILVENEAGALSRISGLFSARGYRVIDRATAPADVQGTSEFKSMCPASATCMSKTVG